MGLRAAQSNCSTEALYREHGAAVARLCRSLLRDRAETEDATQQVFLSAHRALLNGAAPREPLAWLLAVARNECYARFRQRAVAPVPAGEAPERSTADASVHVLRAGELANRVGRGRTDAACAARGVPPAGDPRAQLRPARRRALPQPALGPLAPPACARPLAAPAPRRRRPRRRAVGPGAGPARRRRRRRLAGTRGDEGGRSRPRRARARERWRRTAHRAPRHDIAQAPDAATPSGSPRARCLTLAPPSRAVPPRGSCRGPRTAAPGPRALEAARTAPATPGGQDRPSGTSSGEGSRGAGDGGGGTVAVAQPTTDGHDAGGSSSSGSDGRLRHDHDLLRLGRLRLRQLRLERLTTARAGRDDSGSGARTAPSGGG